MHAEAGSGRVFRIEQKPSLRTVHSGEIVDPVAKKAALDKKIRAIRTALAAQAIPDEEAWRLVSEYLATETKVDMAKLAQEEVAEEATGTPLDLVHDFLVGKRAVHRDMIAIGSTNMVPEVRRSNLAEASKRLPLLHAAINLQLATNADHEIVRTQVQALRIVESLLMDSPQAGSYKGYMPSTHRERLPWVAPNLRP